ncbi:MAG: hypothetical protein K2Q25_07785 [Mycobacteriaceae bacterium]|nr:hypothetical protein [Mycobacteriaceae bacterium]
MLIRLPFKPSRAAQAATAVLAALGAIGAELLSPKYVDLLPADWAHWIATGLTLIAALAGFIRSEAPLINRLDELTK